MKNKMFDETSKLTKKRLLTIVVGAALVLAALVYVYSTGSLKNTTWTGKDSDGKSVVLTFHTREQASIRMVRWPIVKHRTFYCKYDFDGPILTLTDEGPFVNGLIEGDVMKLTSVHGFSATVKRK